MNQPRLTRHARLRWDPIRSQHQLLYPEGMLVLNESAAAILALCDGRSVEEIADALAARFDGVRLHEISTLVDRLMEKGLVDDEHPAAAGAHR